MAKSQGSKRSPAQNRNRDNKGRFTRDEPAQEQQRSPSSNNTLTTTRRDSYQDPGNGWVNEQNAAALRAGAELRSLLEDYLHGSRSLVYSPPEWAQKAIAHEGGELKKYLNRREKLERTKLYHKVFSFNSLQLLLAVGAIAATNIYVAVAPQLGLPLGAGASRGFVGTTDAIYSREIQEGDEIAGYVVSSPYGDRSDPVNGEAKNHEGVDLATPSGTNIYGLGSGGTVECQEDPNGYGTFAIITPTDLPYEFLAGHLSKCVDGDYSSGLAIAQTGNSGKSTGEHLHWEMRSKDSKEPMHPTEGYLWWAMSGVAPKPHGGEQAETGFSSATDLFSRIVEQESGGDHTQINPDSGAIGIGQVMPENVPSWTEQCLGQSMTADQFAGDADAQKKVVNCKLEEYLQAAKDEGEGNFEACRSVAAQWYSGDPTLKDSSTPQDGYPSIADYTKSVCAGYGG